MVVAFRSDAIAYLYVQMSLRCLLHTRRRSIHLYSLIFRLGDEEIRRISHNENSNKVQIHFATCNATDLKYESAVDDISFRVKRNQQDV